MKNSRFVGIVGVIFLICLVVGIGAAAFVYFQNKQESPDLGYVQGMIAISAYPGTRLELIDESLKKINLQRIDQELLNLDTLLYFTVAVPLGREKEFVEKMKEFPWVKNADLNYTIQIPDCSKGPC